VRARREPEPVPVYRYRRTEDPADLLQAARLFRRAPDGHYSRPLRHHGPVAFVADELGLSYRHAAGLVWDAFEEGLLDVEDRRPVPVEVRLVELVAAEADDVAHFARWAEGDPRLAWAEAVP
jgi:hypothetical protein